MRWCRELRLSSPSMISPIGVVDSDVLNAEATAQVQKLADEAAEWRKQDAVRQSKENEARDLDYKRSEAKYLEHVGWDKFTARETAGLPANDPLGDQ